MAAEGTHTKPGLENTDEHSGFNRVSASPNSLQPCFGYRENNNKMYKVLKKIMPQIYPLQSKHLQVRFSKIWKVGTPSHLDHMKETLHRMFKAT